MTPEETPAVPTVKPLTEEERREKFERFAAFATVTAAIRKATGGRKSRKADLTGPELRRTRRILERRERRFAGAQVGAVAPSLSARKMAVSGLEASVLAESVTVLDVPDAELAAALRDLETPWSEWTPEVTR